MIDFKKKMAKNKKKPDIVIFEGWCVGATPQKNKDLLVTNKYIRKKKKIKKEFGEKELIWSLKQNIKKYLS